MAALKGRRAGMSSAPMGSLGWALADLNSRGQWVAVAVAVILSRRLVLPLAGVIVVIAGVVTLVAR